MFFTIGIIINKILSTKYAHLIKIITIIISYTNSFANPLLYIFLSEKFLMIQKFRKWLETIFIFFNIRENNNNNVIQENYNINGNFKTYNSTNTKTQCIRNELGDTMEITSL